MAKFAASNVLTRSEFPPLSTPGYRHARGVIPIPDGTVRNRGDGEKGHGKFRGAHMGYRGRDEQRGLHHQPEDSEDGHVGGNRFVPELPSPKLEGVSRVQQALREPARIIVLITCKRVSDWR